MEEPRLPSVAALTADSWAPEVAVGRREGAPRARGKVRRRPVVRRPRCGAESEVEEPQLASVAALTADSWAPEVAVGQREGAPRARGKVPWRPVVRPRPAAMSLRSVRKPRPNEQQA